MRLAGYDCLGRLRRRISDSRYDIRLQPSLHVPDVALGTAHLGRHCTRGLGQRPRGHMATKARGVISPSPYFRIPCDYHLPPYPLSQARFRLCF